MQTVQTRQTSNSNLLARWRLYAHDLPIAQVVNAVLWKPSNGTPSLSKRPLQPAVGCSYECLIARVSNPVSNRSKSDAVNNLFDRLAWTVPTAATAAASATGCVKHKCLTQANWCNRLRPSSGRSIWAGVCLLNGSRALANRTKNKKKCTLALTPLIFSVHVTIGLQYALLGHVIEAFKWHFRLRFSDMSTSRSP